MGKFIEILNDRYNEQKRLEESLEMESSTDSKLGYLGANIFSFTTYDYKVDEIFAKNMIDVLSCIAYKNFTKYFECDEQYLNYLRMVNTLFLDDKLDWGTSIRHTWFYDKKYEINCKLCDPIVIDKGEIVVFIKDLIEWSK